ncbi:MAG: RluA family pseudouridine synthase [Cyanobacteria bacterium J06634_5]
MAMSEAETLAQLAQLKQTLVALKALPARAEHDAIAQQYARQLERLSHRHRQRKVQRDRDRAHYNNTHYKNTVRGSALAAALSSLAQESQQDSTEKRRLKQAKTQALRPLLEAIAQANEHMRVLKQRYTALSKAWQAELHHAYIRQHKSTPVAPLPIVYQDEALMVIDKPAGLLSVPGRRYHLQDSVLSRLRCQLPEQLFIRLVHRLDQATSGLLVVATCAIAHAALSTQFAQRTLCKKYEALLSHPIEVSHGVIELPLWGAPQQRPKQVVDRQRGKPSQTTFTQLSSGEHPRVELVPQTGRTHQLRVHMAQGLQSPILGDSLYGTMPTPPTRLHLHATTLELTHPLTKQVMTFESAAPF